MASGYKLRLPDGSEIGPLNLEELKGWHTRGLVGKDSPVLRPGGSRWVPLRDVVRLEDLAPLSAGGASNDLRAAVRAATSPGARRTTGRAGGRSGGVPAPEPTQKWRVGVAGALLLISAAAATFWMMRPERWLATLGRAPWRELALGQLALGLLLVRGWEVGRRLGRVALLAAACSLFPIAGILVAQKAPLTALGVIAAAFVFLVGLAFWLAAGYLPAWQSALRLLPVLLGLFGIMRFGYVPERPDAARIREWARSERTLEDAARGARLVLPPGWVALVPDQRLLAAPAGTWAVLAEARLGARALVAVEGLSAPLAAEELLGRALARRRFGGPTELERGDTLLGAVRGRRAATRFESDGGRYLDVSVAARDGRQGWTLSAWMPDDGSTQPAQELATLLAGFSLDGQASARQQDLLLRITNDLPFLNLAAAELVCTGSAAAEQGTARVLRRGLELADRGSTRLGMQEAEELDRLLAAAVRLLPKGERDRLAAYLVRQRAGRLANDVEDERAAPLLKRALLSLPDQGLARLQGLYEQAIRIATGAQPAS